MCNFCTLGPRVSFYLHVIFTDLDPRLSGLVWTAMFVSLAIVITLPRPSGIRTLIAATILRLIFSVGLELTLLILGGLNVSKPRQIDTLTPSWFNVGPAS